MAVTESPGRSSPWKESDAFHCVPPSALIYTDLRYLLKGLQMGLLMFILLNSLREYLRSIWFILSSVLPTMDTAANKVHFWSFHPRILIKGFMKWVVYLYFKIRWGKMSSRAGKLPEIVSVDNCKCTWSFRRTQFLIWRPLQLIQCFSTGHWVSSESKMMFCNSLQDVHHRGPVHPTCR